MPGASKGAATQSDPPADNQDENEQAQPAPAAETSEQHEPTPPVEKPVSGESPKTEEDKLKDLRSLFDEEVQAASGKEQPKPEEPKKDDEPPAEGDTPPAPADATKPEGEQPKPETPAEADEPLELTEDDKREKPRARKRIERLAGKLKEWEPDVKVGRSVRQLQKESGLNDEETGFGLNVLAGIKRADPRVIPLIEKSLDDLYQLTGQKREQPKTEAELPEPEAFTGVLPDDLQNSVALGFLTVEQAREDASNRAWRKKLAEAKAARAKQAKETQPPPQQTEQRPPAADQARAQLELQRQAKAVNDDIDRWLSGQGVKDLKAHYQRLIPVLAKDAPNGDPNQIPVATRLAEVKAAHRAVLLEEAKSKTTTTPTKGPPAPIRQTGLGGAASSTTRKESSTLRDLYREEAAAHK